MKEFVKLVIDFEGAGGRLVGEPTNKAEPETRERPISPEEMRGALQEIKHQAALIASAYIRAKATPSKWEKIKLLMCRDFNDAGYSKLAPIFIEEIEKRDGSPEGDGIGRVMSKYGSREES